MPQSQEPSYQRKIERRATGAIALVARALQEIRALRRQVTEFLKLGFIPGPAGKDGVDGKPGKDGRNGVDGKPGKDGRDGRPGTEGRDGKDGRNGVDGRPGKDGRDGVDGKGLPAGGELGDVLVKTGNDDFVAGWRSPSTFTPKPLPKTKRSRWAEDSSAAAGGGWIGLNRDQVIAIIEEFMPIDAGEENLTPTTATVTSSGSTTIYTPAAGKCAQIRKIYALNEPQATTPALIKVLLGSTEKIRSFGIMTRQLMKGAVDDPVIINLDVAGRVAVTAWIEDVDP